MYQVLYRKWRPKTFEDVIGQEHITATLKNEIISGNTAHAYLFTGTRGIGKTTCAKILAKAMNCKNPKAGNPCLECDVCVGIENESIMDVTEIDAASNNSVENIRDMREEAFFAPSICKFRVYIVDEVHMLSAGAFNAFLKILEEPPAHVVFILATTEIHKLPATVVSRCQRFDFYRPKTVEISKTIESVCEKENIKIEKDAVKIISEASDGGIRDALSILDRCINREKSSVCAEEIKGILGAAGESHILDIADAICEKNAQKCLEVIDEIHSKSKNILKFFEETLGYFRDLMIFKTAKEAKKNAESLGKNSEKLSLPEIFHVLDALQSSYNNMAFGVNKKLEAEISIIKICSEKTKEEPSNLIKNLETRLLKLENDFKNLPFKSSGAQPAKNIQSRPLSSAEIAYPPQADAKPFEQWVEILGDFAKSSNQKSISVALKGSEAYTTDKFVLINAKNSLALELLREPANKEAVKDAIEKATGKRYNLGPYKPSEIERKYEKAAKKEDKAEQKLAPSEPINEPKSEPSNELINKSAGEQDSMDEFLNEIKDDGIEVKII